MEVTPADRAVAFSLLSLHKYSRWVSSLRSSRPLSAAAAGKELQAMAGLRSHFPGLSKRIRTVLALHLELIGCVAAGTANKPGRSLQTTEFLALVTRQGEAVARLTAACEGLTATGAVKPAFKPPAFNDSDWAPCQS